VRPRAPVFRPRGRQVQRGIVARAGSRVRSGRMRPLRGHRVPPPGPDRLSRVYNARLRSKRSQGTSRLLTPDGSGASVAANSRATWLRWPKVPRLQGQNAPLNKVLTTRLPGGIASRPVAYSALPEPMLARSGRLPASGDYSYEVKWDGFRAIVSNRAEHRRGVCHGLDAGVARRGFCSSCGRRPWSQAKTRTVGSASQRVRGGRRSTGRAM